MVVKHNKTDNLYQLLDDECKVKINGEWVDAVIYQGKDKETGKTKCFVREKSDFESHFTAVDKVRYDCGQQTIYRICVLKEVAEEYPGKTIKEVIAQIGAGKKEMAKVPQNNIILIK